MRGSGVMVLWIVCSKLQIQQRCTSVGGASVFRRRDTDKSTITGNHLCILRTYCHRQTIDCELFTDMAYTIHDPKAIAATCLVVVLLTVSYQLLTQITS
jgi:hypothetical protein